MRSAVRVYLALIAAQARAQMQYRLGFLLSLTTAFAATIVDFIGLSFFFIHFPDIGGWRLPEIALLYVLVNLPFSVAHLLGEGFEDFRRYVQLGELDRLLLRPRAVALQVAGDGLALRQFGRLAQVLVVAALTWRWLDLGARWSAADWLLAGWAMLGGLAFYLGVFLLSATLCFWTVESIELANIVTYGSTEMAIYPMPIFGRWLRRTFTYLVPLAFVNYYPALILLDRPDPTGLPPWTGWAAPLVCLAVLGLGRAAWGVGLRRYQSTGS
ncbi:MAG: ABC transporter permease [Anaerolineae bacterium]